jgi:hypothetical protein
MTANRFRFVVAALVVLLAAELGGRALVAASGSSALRWHDYSAELKVEQMTRAQSADVVVVGTSMAQQALVPRFLSAEGASTYNAGLNGGVPVVTEQWLRDHVEPRLEPATVLWALGPLDISAVYGDATLNAYETALETKDGSPAEAERLAASVSSLVRNRTVLRDPSELLGIKATARNNGRAEARSATGEGGERIEFQPAVSPARAAEVRGRVTPFALDRDDLAALARSASRLKDKQVEVILVELPVPDRFNDLYPAGPQQAELVRAALEVLAAELDVPLIRVSGSYANDDFVDYTHLNQPAAERFTLETAAALADLD